MPISESEYDNWKLQESPCGSAAKEEAENALIVRLADMHQYALAAGLSRLASKLASILEPDDIDAAKYRALGYGDPGEWPPAEIPF